MVGPDKFEQLQYLDFVALVHHRVILDRLEYLIRSQQTLREQPRCGKDYVQ